MKVLNLPGKQLKKLLCLPWLPYYFTYTVFPIFQIV